MREVLENPRSFGDLFTGILDNDPVVRARAADAAEKVTRLHPEYLQPFRTRLIVEVAKIPQQEIRWHLAQMFPRLDLAPSEKTSVIELLFSWIDGPERSRIVKAFGLQSLAGLASHGPSMRPRVMKKLREYLKNGSPAMKSRSKRLIKQLGKSK